MALRPSSTVVAVTCLALATSSAARAQSAVDGFDPGANSEVRTILVQPDGKIVVGGEFTTLGNGSGGPGVTPRWFIGRFNIDGSLDGFDPHPSSSVHALALQADGKILVGGFFGSIAGVIRNRVARLNPDGSIDNAFIPGADDLVDTIVVQPDGKILLGGLFTQIMSAGGAIVARNYIARLNADGTLDATFDPGADFHVLALALQPDGKILVGGKFTTLGGAARHFIGRLNADGSLDSTFDLHLTGSRVSAIAVQPGGRILLGGIFSAIGSTSRQNLARVWPDGVVDPRFDPQPDSEVICLAIEPAGSILVGGAFQNIGGYARLSVARLFINGVLDLGFDPGARRSGLPYATVDAFGVQSDGKIVVGGSFTNFGRAGTVPRFHIARVHAGGTLDADFDPNADGSVTAIAIQPDDHVLVGGAFNTLGGVSVSGVGRLKPDGSMDVPFYLGGAVHAIAVQPDGRIIVGGNFISPFPYLSRFYPEVFTDSSFNPGLNGQVYALAIQPDGKILVGGSFTLLGGGGSGTTVRRRIGRLNADGSLDTTFNPGANGRVLSFAIQPDGRIIVAGEFTMIGGGGSGNETHNRIARLMSNGLVDHSFDGGADGSIFATALQTDGSVLVGGDFTTLGGDAEPPTDRKAFGRFTADGLVDPGFDVAAGSAVNAIAIQTDGGIIIGGFFSSVFSNGSGGIGRRRIARFNSDGSLDEGFDPGANGVVRALALQADGRVIVGGDFTTLGGGGTGLTPRNRLGRLTNTGPAFQELTVYPSGLITWLRSGTGPELSQVLFESSSNGTSYSSLAAAERIPEGWELSAPSLIGGRVWVRATGQFSTGQDNGGQSIATSVRHANSPIPFSDDPIVAGVTSVRAAHISELRARIDALRARFGPGVWTWGSGTIAAGGSVLATHVAELRTALFGAYAAAGHPQPVYTDPIITPLTTVIYAVHLRELRAAILLLELS